MPVIYDYNSLDIYKSIDAICYTYYYCIEAPTEDCLPEGLIRIEIPQGKYAVFSYDKVNNTLNGEKLNQSVYDYIDGFWLPNSGYELCESVDYEVFDEINNIISYFISIK